MQTQKVIDHIVNWLKDYAVKANVKGYVIGVSGGVDSGVVSTLCAMTGLEVLLLEMPIRQKEDQVNRAQDHIEDLKKKFPNVNGKTINLTPVFESFEDKAHSVYIVLITSTKNEIFFTTKDGFLIIERFDICSQN